MPLPETLRLSIESVEFFMRNVRTRIPFRYGNAVLRGAPILHVRMHVRSHDGREAMGVSGDNLPPRWFDKNLSKTYAQNVADLLDVAQIGRRKYLDRGSEDTTVFDLWLDAYNAVMDEAMGKGHNALLSGFGSSLMERALIDGAGHLLGRDFHNLVREGMLGIEPMRVHPSLEGRSASNAVAATPSDTIALRHTVGLSDAIYEADVAEPVDDGLPESMEGWLWRTPLHYFKIKIFGDLERDRDRLTQLAQLFKDRAPADYRLSFDGNENFDRADVLAEWIAKMGEVDALNDLMRRVMYIEQPMERSITLTAEGSASFANVEGLPPVIIDESDDSLKAFEQAAALGYRGTSVKSCKGVIKGLLNKLLVDAYNEKSQGRFILTGEDLTTLPVVPLQEDLCLMSSLGMDHLERNGHHYFRGLDHLSPVERERCFAAHGALYEPLDDSAQLRIEDGRLDVRSLRVPGFGVGIDLDWDEMTPLDEWTFDSLGIEE